VRLWLGMDYTILPTVMTASDERSLGPFRKVFNKRSAWDGSTKAARTGLAPSLNPAA
jgi:hypothetical protein